jgi:hypothetical protein
MDNYKKMKPDRDHGTPHHLYSYPPMSPNYPPPFVPPYELPSDKIDELLPTVPFTYRPAAYKAAIGLIIAGIVLCLLMSIFMIYYGIYSIFSYIILTLFLTIIILGIISIILLLIPKRIGWYIALLTAIFGLIGFGIGTLIAIFAIVALFWPSTRFYFKTGQVWQTMPMMPYPYPPPPGY